MMILAAEKRRLEDECAELVADVLVLTAEKRRLEELLLRWRDMLSHYRRDDD
jgi:hypothetical protein